MFDLFTDQARRVVLLAQDEARGFDHPHLGTEHLLLGLVREGDGIAARCLGRLGIDLDRARQQVTQLRGRGQEPPTSPLPFTDRAKKVLEYALAESRDLGHHHIGPEHLLLGLVHEGEETGGGCAVTALTGLGAPLDRVRQQTMDLLAGG